MGKRSNFKRRAHDLYMTPPEAIRPLVPFIRDVRTFAEPCAGDGRLVHALETRGPMFLHCVHQSDLHPRFDLFAPSLNALDLDLRGVDAIITNPPWTRAILHPMIDRFMRQAPTWLLFDADWKHNRQAASFLPNCSHIVSVGRVKWFGTGYGKDNCAWYRFDIRHQDGPRFFGR